MRIFLITPAPPGKRTGNETTTTRWLRILTELGHEARIASRWEGEECDVLVALHAWKSFDSIRGFRQRHRERPLILALTGTDLYGDLQRHPDCWRSVEAATRLVALQPLALKQLPKPVRRKARVVYQSVPTIDRAPPRPHKDSFEVCVVAHLRPVKDPFRAAFSSHLLPPASRIRILQVGGALDPEMETEALLEQRRNPRFQWLGNVPREEVLELLGRVDLMVHSSEREGGANAVGEALAASLPILASEIPGNVGLLGESYPGYFPVGDTLALAELMRRAESDPSFLAKLKEHCARQRPLFDPELETESWRDLLDSSIRDAQDVDRIVTEISRHIDAQPLASPVTGDRRSPRLSIREEGEVQLWLGGVAGNDEYEPYPATLNSVSAEGFAASLPLEARTILPRVAAITLRVPGFPSELPGRRAWTYLTDEGCHIGVHLQLAAATGETRRAFASWIKSLQPVPD